MDDFNLPPLPWNVTSQGCIKDAKGRIVASLQISATPPWSEDRFIAAYMVACVNAHPAPPTLTGLLAEAHALVTELRATIEAARARPNLPSDWRNVPTVGIDGRQFLGLDEPLFDASEKSPNFPEGNP